ncbi:hypothetical protein B0H63DRAFT_479210 [Podospora didyma]|uniref:Aflatoxin biosynthesis ketoreductase nor-1 n=1 Tax=Podospora didyma TaxID=330526 RepID=A0AAE0KLN1_9PEZI|nr:hypothetical protein B0H63DRAFT_479210 [Podospora didyma]
MTESTVIVITGVNRGIGKSLTQTYLSRPNHTVISSVRDTAAPSVEKLKSPPTTKNSHLILIKIESSYFTDPSDAIRKIEAAGVSHVDVVIANAGGAGGVIDPLETVTPESVIDRINVNALGPLAPFQAARPLLLKSKSPKWVSVSSAVGSIGNMENFKSHIAPAYGIAKAVMNWTTMVAHCGNPWLTSFAVHLG